MKGFLLAAGVGTRLRPLTNAIPKCLVPIQGAPLLAIWLEWCAMYGIDEILLNSHAHGDHVREFVDAYRGPVRVTLTHEPELLGSAGTLHVNRDFVAGEKEFAVLYADVLTNCRFDRLLDFHQMRHSPVTLGTYRVPNPTQCGIIATDESGKVVDFVEKPQLPKADTAFSGILIGGPALLDRIPKKFLLTSASMYSQSWSERCLLFPSPITYSISAPWKSTNRHSGSGPDSREITDPCEAHSLAQTLRISAARRTVGPA